MSPRISLEIFLLFSPGFTYFVPVSISTINWDLSKLLVLSGDVESKTGPGPIYKNIVFCLPIEDYSAKYGSYYYARCHQAIKHAVLVWKLRTTMTTGNVTRVPSAKLNSWIQRLSTTWMYKFNSFPASTSWFSEQFLRSTNGMLMVSAQDFQNSAILLINSDIYVLAVQESKLRKVDKALFIEGYVTVRKDHNNILGGGLLLSIQTDTA